MFISAAEGVAEQVTAEDFENGLIYPRIRDIMKVSINVAVKVAEEIFAGGYAGVEKPEDIRAFIISKMYVPAYI
jgi:malate dehydrogenase (oxaloacetate-decarboxylating)(NADP+)